MLRTVSVIAVLGVGASLAYAQSASIAQRKEAMKAIAAAAKAPAGMAKGEVKFDLAPVQAALTVYQEQSAKLKSLWPDDSKTGGDTQVLPAAFEKKAAFLALFDKLAADAKAAAGAIKDEASFKAEWGKVMGNCGACHKEYRVPPKS